MITINGTTESERATLSEILYESEDDVKNGRIAPLKDTLDDLRSILESNDIGKA